MSEYVLVWATRAARPTWAPSASQAGIPNCGQTWGHWLRHSVELRWVTGGLQCWLLGRARDGQGPWWLGWALRGFGSLIFLLLYSSARDPAFTMFGFWDFFFPINCSYCFCFHHLPGKWLSWWSDIFTGSYTEDAKCYGLWCSELGSGAPRNPSKNITTGFLLCFFFFFLYLQVTWKSPFKSHRKCHLLNRMRVH